MQVLARFSGMAFQMLGTIVLGTFAGLFLDTHLNLVDFKLFTLIGAVASVVLALYVAIRGV